MAETEDLITGLDMELRRSTLVLCVLSRLRTPQYGYNMVQQLAERGIEIDISTLYPLLRRLEKQGICTAEWVTESSKPRKYYKMTAQGEMVYQALCTHWLTTTKSITLLLEKQYE